MKNSIIYWLFQVKTETGSICELFQVALSCAPLCPSRTEKLAFYTKWSLAQSFPCRDFCTQDLLYSADPYHQHLSDCKLICKYKGYIDIYRHECKL